MPVVPSFLSPQLIDLTPWTCESRVFGKSRRITSDQLYWASWELRCQFGSKSKRRVLGSLGHGPLRPASKLLYFIYSLMLLLIPQSCGPYPHGLVYSLLQAGFAGRRRLSYNMFVWSVPRSNGRGHIHSQWRRNPLVQSPNQDDQEEFLSLQKINLTQLDSPLHELSSVRPPNDARAPVTASHAAPQPVFDAGKPPVDWHQSSLHSAEQLTRFK
jgi:hypothetical protein